MSATGTAEAARIEDDALHAPHVELPGLRRIARHAGPRLMEATVVPLVLFYAGMATVGVFGALLVALAWSYAALLRRLVRGERLPGMLLLGTLGLTARTAISFASGSVFLYFLQPTLGTVAVAAAFLLSVPAGRPLAERLAADICPLPPDVVSSAPVRTFFARVSVLWALVYLVNAGVTLWLLLSQPLGVYLVATKVMSLVLSGSALVVSVVWFRRTVRPRPPISVRELVPVPALAA
jgi:uncharacterized membrane protein